MTADSLALEDLASLTAATTLASFEDSGSVSSEPQLLPARFRAPPVLMRREDWESASTLALVLPEEALDLGDDPSPGRCSG